MHVIVHKPDEDVSMLILPHKGTEQYSFVNLTKGHICPCKFNSLDEALADMTSRGIRFTVLPGEREGLPDHVKELVIQMNEMGA